MSYKVAAAASVRPKDTFGVARRAEAAKREILYTPLYMGGYNIDVQ